MKINVNETTKLQLDWLVMKCEGFIRPDGGVYAGKWQGRVGFKPSSDPAQGQPILEREGISTTPMGDFDSKGTLIITGWNAKAAIPYDDLTKETNWHDGPSMLIAGLRCFVVRRLGEIVDVPDEVTEVLDTENGDSPQVPQAHPYTSILSFGFFNKAGGTDMSDGRFGSPAFTGTTSVRVTKCWLDDEMAMRFMGVSNDAALTEYLGEVANEKDSRIFFGEFDLTAPILAQPLAVAFNAFIEKHATSVRTSDGYTFTRLDDGSWTDGDLTWLTFDSVNCETGGDLEIITTDQDPSL